MSIELEEIAQQVQRLALGLGADEVSVSASQSISTELTQRAGRIEKTQQSNSLSVGVELLVDDKFSSHSASDIRPESLKPFLKRAIQATHFLEKDANRKLPNLNDMGVADDCLDVSDSSWKSRTPERRKAHLTALEQTCKEHTASAPVRSITTHVWDGFVQSHVCSSNGYSKSSGDGDRSPMK